ncbi:MAG: prolipoprotein diacylglyceryl transferase [Holdemanella sp.]|nr:prolipoprotein diacylglyceryl transferase [Holdemanella sp.]
MKPIFFSFGNIHIYAYGFMIGLGLLVAGTLAERSAYKKGLDGDTVFSLILWCIIGGAIGGKLLFYMTILDTIMKNPSVLLNIGSGFVVYGSIIGAIVAAMIYARFKKIDILTYVDHIIPYGALTQAFGRIGCFMAGCCYGKETSSAIGVIFPSGGLAPPGIPLIPTQLISSALNLCHFFFLLYISKKVKHKGQVFCIYLICYSIGRFVLEYFRGDLVRGSVGIFSTSQFISIFILLCGVGLFYYLSKREKA